MASVQFNYAGNMLSPVVVYGTVTNATSTNINIVGNTGINYWQANYYGTGFTYSGYEVTGGTLQSYTHSVNGVLSYRVSDVSVPAATAARYIQSGDLYGLEQIVLDGTDWIGGSNYSDSLAGFGGNDGIRGAGGNDYIDGGSGLDTAIFSGSINQYTGGVNLDGRVNVVDTVSNRDGTDTLVNIERLQFSDTMVGLDVGKGENTGEVYRLYLTVLGRSPEPVGCGFWIDKLDRGILSTEEMVGSFLNSEEFVTRFGGTTNANEDFVNLLYLNLLGRDGHPDSGFNFWLGVLDEKRATREEVVVGFMESDENISNAAAKIGDTPVYQQWVE